jgi:hypothetical protein
LQRSEDSAEIVRIKGTKRLKGTEEQKKSRFKKQVR